MSLRITPFTPVLGAEISGLEVDSLVDDTRQALYRAFLEFHVLCIRSPVLDPGQLLRIAQVFGTPKPQLLRRQRLDALPQISILDSTYTTPAEKPADPSTLRLAGWHTDDSFCATPAKATVLQSLNVPSTGGQTRFCNARTAFADLDAKIKERITQLSAVHAYDTERAPGRALLPAGSEVNDATDAVHPLVRKHDETGHDAIFFNSNRTDRVFGWNRSESDALLNRLHSHMTQAKYEYAHSWRIGDILVWDNRSVVHCVNMDYPVGELRRHHRILIEGSPVISSDMLVHEGAA
jgi:taurine dioxygenase